MFKTDQWLVDSVQYFSAFFSWENVLNQGLFIDFVFSKKLMVIDNILNWLSMEGMYQNQCLLLRKRLFQVSIVLINWFIKIIMH